ncbi:MAG: lipoyl synthase [Anaerolineales bacterium]|nr:lipoyl synthase [Anaerolineales bacterium]
MPEPVRDRICSPEGQEPPRPARRPEWIRLAKPPEEKVKALRSLMRAGSLHTVCEEAMCPNFGECWSRGTATFLLLGDICTRACGFCDVKHGRPAPLDPGEPERVARTAADLGLRHVVITSVTRDELPDGGAAVFAETIRRVRGTLPGSTIEVLIPDFKGNESSLRLVLDAHPDILNHNVETVPRLFRKVQPQDRYAWARATLEAAKQINPAQLTKSGIMVGLGETFAEVVAMMRELRRWQVDILTIGQYLQPSRRHLPVECYYTPQEFSAWKRIGLEELGFRWVESAPLVRSSYRADEQAAALVRRDG